jgi:ferric-dicitrate binding protein FerR (iron transport regulator)
MEDRIFDIIGNKFSGQDINPEDQKILSEWLQKEENRLKYEELERAWNISNKIRKEIKPNVDEEWERFKMLRNENRDNNKKTFHISRISIAATILILFGLFIAYNQYIRDKKISIIADKADKEVVLPDGSVAWLNSGSTLSYNKEFAENNRKIDMSGEAYFKVVKNNIPFEIHTPHEVITRVLGTEFNLRAQAVENSTELTVISGKVSFGKDGNTNNRVFEKNQQVVLDNSSGKIILKENVNENSLAWKTHSLKFNNTPLEIVVNDLERYFNLDIIVPEYQEELFFSGDFTKPTVKQIAQIIDISFKWEHTFNEKKLHFSKAD